MAMVNKNNEGEPVTGLSLAAPQSRDPCAESETSPQGVSNRMYILETRRRDKLAGHPFLLQPEQPQTALSLSCPQASLPAEYAVPMSLAVCYIVIE